MNLNKKEAILLLIIVCLAVGWLNAVLTQQSTVTHVKTLYNQLVKECNRIIGAQNVTDFCITLPGGQTQCNQKDLNLFYSVG